MGGEPGGFFCTSTSDPNASPSQPSLPPLGGVPKGSKAGTGRLLLQIGRTHHMRARYEDAASLFQQVLQVATGEENRS